jgi:phosphoribosylformimino-5-aminoimidazole carboxamide ribotide isomerase
MLIPSIDLMGGRIVQLVHGEKLQLAFDDFEYWIDRFSEYPLVQLIDLDAAMRIGDNGKLIEEIAKRLPCQVGGGIGSVEKAREVLDSGARRVIVGSAFFRVNVSGVNSGGDKSGSDLVDTGFADELCQSIGAEQIVCSVDTKSGRIAVKGWTAQIGLTPEAAIAKLEPYCVAFLYTHIDKEGTMEGFPLEIARKLRGLTGRQLIVAGGIRELAEIEALDSIRVDAVAGMAVYTGILKV